MLHSMTKEAVLDMTATLSLLSSLFSQRLDHVLLPIPGFHILSNPLRRLITTKYKTSD
jgi:hypothetical protein